MAIDHNQNTKMWGKFLAEYEDVIARNEMEKHTEKLNCIYQCPFQGISAKCSGSTEEGMTNIGSLSSAYQSLSNIPLKSKYSMHIYFSY